MRGNHVKTKYDLVRAFAPWAMVCSVTIWGYSYVVTKIALNVHTDPLILTAGCYIYGALGAAPLIFIKRHELLKKGVLTEAMVMEPRFLYQNGCSLSDVNIRQPGKMLLLRERMWSLSHSL